MTSEVNGPGTTGTEELRAQLRARLAEANGHVLLEVDNLDGTESVVCACNRWSVDDSVANGGPTHPEHVADEQMCALEPLLAAHPAAPGAAEATLSEEELAALRNAICLDADGLRQEGPSGHWWGWMLTNSQRPETPLLAAVEGIVSARVADARAEELRAAADAFNTEGLSLKPGGWGSSPADQQTIQYAAAVVQWLRERAARGESR